MQLKVYDGELQQRMGELLRSQLCITVNSDDPGVCCAHASRCCLHVVSTSLPAKSSQMLAVECALTAPCACAQHTLGAT